jgi:hypothetical protein
MTLPSKDPGFGSTAHKVSVLRHHPYLQTLDKAYRGRVSKKAKDIKRNALVRNMKELA